MDPSVTSIDASKMHRRLKSEIVPVVGMRQAAGEIDGDITHRRYPDPRGRGGRIAKPRRSGVI